MRYYRELRVVVILETRKGVILYGELACTHSQPPFASTTNLSAFCECTRCQTIDPPQIQHGTASTATLGTPGPSRSMS